MSEHNVESDLPENWFAEELKRAKARRESIPESARPSLNLRPTPVPRGCHCGHPGAGCTCQHRAERVPSPEPGEPSIAFGMDDDRITFCNQAALDEYVRGAIAETTAPALEAADIESDAREALARQLVRDRLHFYGITDEEIDAERLMEPVDHDAHDCAPVQSGQWECFNEYDSPTHPRHDWADEAAEWVCWVLDHPLVATSVTPPEVDE